MNNLTGIIASAVLILGYRLNDGDVAKYFGLFVGFAIALSLVNYLAIFPAFWMLRNKFPDARRPYLVPAHRTVSIWLTVVVAFGITQLIAPGLGDSWFGDAYRPAGWVADQGLPYYATQLGGLLVIVLVAVVFWVLGKRNLEKVPESSSVVEVESAEEELASDN
jgi:amino acid transporter